ncbi:ComEA family DNA-binding protein [Streptomyces spectabilis]
MALRSPSRTAADTASDELIPAPPVRATTHRHARRRARRRRAAAEAMRLRAETLFAGAGGPDPGRVRPRRAGVGGEEWRGAPSPPPSTEPEQVGSSPEGGRDQEDGYDRPARAKASWRARAGLAVRERLPVWMQLRCGLERRSVLALGVVLVVAAGFAAQHFWSGRAQPVRAPDVVGEAAAPGRDAGPSPSPGALPDAGLPPGAEAAEGSGAGATGEAGATGGGLVVDVSGKVRSPGVLRLPAGSRVADALRAAGGVRPGTKTDGLNRARLLVDGEQLLVGGAPPAAPGVPAGGAAAGPSGAPGATTGPVALNSATPEQLDTLPGVGPVLAQHIIDYRTEHGGFRSVDELREVNGIGDRRFADLRNLVRP